MRCTFRPSSFYRRRARPEDLRKRVVSDAIKSRIFDNADDGVSYKEMSKKFGLPVTYLYGLLSRRQYKKDLPLFTNKNINRHRKVLSESKLTIKDVSLRIYPKNSVPNVKKYLDENYDDLVLSETTISNVLREMGMSFTRRSEIKRYCNADCTKLLRKN